MYFLHMSLRIVAAPNRLTTNRTCSTDNWNVVGRILSKVSMADPKMASHALFVGKHPTADHLAAHMRLTANGMIVHHLVVFALQC